MVTQFVGRGSQLGDGQISHGQIRLIAVPNGGQDGERHPLPRFNDRVRLSLAELDALDRLQKCRDETLRAEGLDGLPAESSDHHYAGLVLTDPIQLGGGTELT